MNEFETMREAGRLQHFARGNETCGVETELRVLAAARRPFASAFAVKTHANSDVRFHADFLCCADCLLELFEFLGNDDHLLAELATEQRDADERRVFVAIANDETFGILVHRQCGDQFRLASGFETKMKLLAGIDNFFNDFAQLINLDRKNTAILILVTELRYRLLKCAVYRFDTVTEQILKSDDQRETQTAIARFIYDFQDVDRAAVFLQRSGHHIPGWVDGEITAAPAIDIVGRDRCVNVPLVFHLIRSRGE